MFWKLDLLLRFQKKKTRQEELLIEIAQDLIIFSATGYIYSSNWCVGHMNPDDDRSAVVYAHKSLQ